MKRVLEHLLPITRHYNIPLDAVTHVYAHHFPGVTTDDDAASMAQSLSHNDNDIVILDMVRTSLADRVLPGVCGYTVYFSAFVDGAVRQRCGFIPMYARSVKND